MTKSSLTSENLRLENELRQSNMMFNKLKEQAERKLKAAGERYHSVKSEAAMTDSSLRRARKDLEALKSTHQSVLLDLSTKQKHCSELSERVTALIQYVLPLSVLLSFSQPRSLHN